MNIFKEIDFSDTEALMTAQQAQADLEKILSYAEISLTGAIAQCWTQPIETDDENIKNITELRQVFDEKESGEILRLCKECSRRSLGRRSVENYVQAAVTDIKLGFSKDHVRYELYQTCMANPRDELRTDTPEEQFFK